MSEHVLEVRDLHVANTLTGAAVVRGVDFSVRRGQVLGIVGESGSGKTVTIRALLGVLPEPLAITGGTISLLGRTTDTFGSQDWTDTRGSVLSAVFQDPGSYLNPSIRLGKQVAEPLRVKTGMSRAEAKAETIRLFEAVNLRDPELVFGQYSHELSGGMLQRVMIAAAISLGPEILIADEATTALDVTVQAEILDLLADLQRSEGLSLVVISHDLTVVAQLCDEVAVMREGEIVERGPADVVLHDPQHEYTQLLVSEHQRYGLDHFINIHTPQEVTRV
ncbi:ABC transporter ATP-binding protein [Cumulibacter soli]|uniref:ABC transporter ATP-binding protein n=1 Tax=Cumulibacter soli TaxID=2546344 RepID=UPI001067C321|nr:ABC transporter ATP-binding protein [Cumulibacter soli]